jgi:predicted ATPase
MKLLHYVEIENFKRYGQVQRIELDHPAVLIGPNNCGKTSVLQAIALWSIGLRTWRAESEGSNAEIRKGKALNRLSIHAVPVPKTRHLWHNLKTGKKDLTIRVGVDVNGTPSPVTVVFRHHPSDELVYCEPSPDSLASSEALEAAANLDVALLYPMSGISSDEAVILRKRVEFLMGRGSTAEVLRNICLHVLEKSPEDWDQITGLMNRLFRIRLGKPSIDEKGGVQLAYEQAEVNGELDLGLSGRGFQQMLLIFAHLHLHKQSVVLIDEPDAHLEILRQQQVFALLRDIARRNGCQVILATHSEVVLRAALDNNLTLILDGEIENLAKKPEIVNALKHFGAEHYVKAREAGHVLYVEGSTDVEMLRAFAERLGHPVKDRLTDGAGLNVYFLQDNYPDNTPSNDKSLERVEGGFGLKAADHFQALKGILPALCGLEIRDNDGKQRTSTERQGLNVRVWKRYELENYFITPELLLHFVASRSPGEDLFSQRRLQILEDLIREQVFDGAVADFEIYRRSDAATRGTLWRSQTKSKKLSTFAEDFFERLASATGTRILARKGNFHELIGLCHPADIDGDVTQMLDALGDLLEP